MVHQWMIIMIYLTMTIVSFTVVPLVVRSPLHRHRSMMVIMHITITSFNVIYQYRNWTIPHFSLWPNKHHVHPWTFVRANHHPYSNDWVQILVTVPVGMSPPRLVRILPPRTEEIIQCDKIIMRQHLVDQVNPIIVVCSVPIRFIIDGATDLPRA